MNPKHTGSLKFRFASVGEQGIDTSVDPNQVGPLGRLLTKQSLRILSPLIETIPSSCTVEQTKNSALAGCSSKDCSTKCNVIHTKHPVERKSGCQSSVVSQKPTNQATARGRTGAPHTLSRKASQLQKKPVIRPQEKLPCKTVKSVIPPIDNKKTLGSVEETKDGAMVEKNICSSSSLSSSSRDCSISSSHYHLAGVSPDTKTGGGIAETNDDSDIPSVSATCSPISATWTTVSDKVTEKETNKVPVLTGKTHTKFDVAPLLNRGKLRTASRARSPSVSEYNSRSLLRHDQNEAPEKRRYSIGDWNKQRAVNLRRGSLRPCSRVILVECKRMLSVDRDCSNNLKPKTSLCANLKPKVPQNNTAEIKMQKRLPPIRKTHKSSGINSIRVKKTRQRDVIQKLVNEEAADSSASKSVSIGSHSDSPCTSPSSPSLLLSRPLTFTSPLLSPGTTAVSSSPASYALLSTLTPNSATSTFTGIVLSPVASSCTPQNCLSDPAEPLRSLPKLSSTNTDAAPVDQSFLSSMNECGLIEKCEKCEDKKNSEQNIHIRPSENNINQEDELTQENGMSLTSDIKTTEENTDISMGTVNGVQQTADINVNESGQRRTTENTRSVDSKSTTGRKETESCVQSISPVGDELSSLPDFYKHIQRRSSSIDSVMSRPGSDFLDVPIFPVQSRDRSPSSSTLDESESPTMSPLFNLSSSEGADLQQQVSCCFNV